MLSAIKIRKHDNTAGGAYRANARANNKGWRLDYNMVSNTLKDKIQRAIILPEAMHSDHCPVMVELDL